MYRYSIMIYLAFALLVFVAILGTILKSNTEHFVATTSMTQVPGFMDFQSGNINAKPSTARNYSDCQSKCVQRANCVATTYDTASKVCNLKNVIIPENIIKDKKDNMILSIKANS